uniref:Condensin complex subunit 2 n=1 Tax=Mucochytrium quahogii TaxID=96639 RepID=A0A7S2SDZ0_9STRA|mmetsp:Transcript_7725/g.14242  ORF Transcript_7725/g.14242 Transcript_7725/m.14242 type:complete len:614 (-) Transcript_7725:1192-3033(-)
MSRRKSLATVGGCILDQNDDDFEIQARRRASIVASAKKQQRKSKTEDNVIEYDFGSVMSMVSANKVNLKNTWSLNLIDHIDDVLEQQHGSFQKASCTLQASVQIYEKRVDSTHQDTFRMLENVNRTRLAEPGNAEENRDNRRKATTKSTMSATFLESNLSAITFQTVEREYEVDPLFRKMSKTFDAGGAKGLLLNHLSVHVGPCIIFDTSETLAFPPKPDDSESQAKHSQNNVALFESVPESNVLPMCPSLEILARCLDSSPIVCSSPLATTGNEDTEKSSADNEMFDESNAFIFDYEDGFEGGGADMDDDGTASFYSNKEPNSQESRKQWNVRHGGIEFSGLDAYSFFKPATLQSSGSGWAGPSHWKFARKKVQQASGIPEKRKRATQKKKTFLIDFKDYTLNKLDVQSPVRPSVINLAKKQRAPCNDLPEDLHYTVRDLCKLFLKPLGLSQVFASSTNKDNRRESTGSNRLNPADDFEDTDAGYFDTFDQTSDDDNKSTQHVNEIDNLVAPSHVVEKIEIDYARRAKRVNVKKLKETMWHELEEHEIEKDGEVGDQPKRHISFAESIKSVGPKVDDPNVTVPFYFICLLHLANENGLELEGREDLSDFIIH